jgi:ATP-dependent Clp protease ATP-binding subunit ClpC
MVDVEGAGPEAKFTFKGVPKPGKVPDAPPAEIASETKAAAGGADGRLANGR